MAAVSAANLDRDKRVVLPRAAIEFTPDPNLPRDIQADPDWFKSSQIDFGHLTTRQEISWGARFAGDDQDASRTLADSVNVLTNVAPQFDNFNRYVWARLEQWILTEHNKEAARVSIFTGPVFSSRDPQVDGAPMPRRFFKIAVSSKPGTEKALVVDAFMIAQFVEGTDDKLVRSDFAPAKYRVAVADIERATGLDFGAAVRNAPTSDSVPSAQPQPETSRPKDIVYFQFAGMSREDAVKLSSGLKALGWNIPGEERTGAAANQNEIRYGTKSAEPIANRLVEDLKALGVAKITAKLNPGLKQGPLEVWVSQ
jgi:DNA/RNA endonuclease G (NUC1)